MFVLCLHLLAPNYLTVSDNGPAGMTNVKQPGGTLPAAVGDGATDDTSAIQAIINHAAKSTNNKVFFPPGEYLVSRDIVIRGSVELHGTKKGIAVIKASTPYAKKIHNVSPVKSVALENLFFDGVRVDFDGRAKGPSSTNNITVESCVFFSTARPTPSNAQKPQLRLARLENGAVYMCVFLRDSNAFGVASRFSRTVSVEVNDNLCGLDLTKIDWLTTQIKPAYDWRDQKEKLRFLKAHYNLASDQGFLKSCLYDECDKKMRIAENVFNGSPNTGNLHKDHAMYLKGFDQMEVTSNYVRGWPADPSGGIKARNGKNLWLARNYIDDTGILLYTHKNVKKKACIEESLMDVVIYGNHIVQRSNPDTRSSSLSYYEPHHTGKDENITYSANVFEIVGVSDPTKYRCIWLTNGDTSHHHVYEDNVYYGTTTKVKLQARHGTPSYEKGAIDDEIKDLCNYPPYKLNIPPYS